MLQGEEKVEKEDSYQTQLIQSMLNPCQQRKQVIGLEKYYQQLCKFIDKRIQQNQITLKVSKTGVPNQQWKNQAGVLLVTGQPGSGKTHLLQHYRWEVRQKYSTYMLNIVNLIGVKWAIEKSQSQILKCFLKKINKPNSILILDQFEQLNQPYFTKYIQIFRNFITNESVMLVVLISNNPKKLSEDKWAPIGHRINIENPQQPQRQLILKGICSRKEIAQMIDGQIDYGLIAGKIGNKTISDIQCYVREVIFKNIRLCIASGKQLPNPITDQFKKFILANQSDFLQVAGK